MCSSLACGRRAASRRRQSRGLVLPADPGRALDPSERRALLAHEEAHLRYRHHLLLLTTQLAAAADPLLRPVVPAVQFAVERWADEAAARHVGDRALVAGSVARASLAQTSAARWSRARPGIALAAARHAVAWRTQALLAPPPSPRRGLAALLMVSPSGSAPARCGFHDTEHHFEWRHAATSPIR